MNYLWLHIDRCAKRNVSINFNNMFVPRHTLLIRIKCLSRRVITNNDNEIITKTHAFEIILLRVLVQKKSMLIICWCSSIGVLHATYN